jgi:hypothetical protein
MPDGKNPRGFLPDFEQTDICGADGCEVARKGNNGSKPNENKMCILPQQNASDFCSVRRTKTRQFKCRLRLILVGDFNG